MFTDSRGQGGYDVADAVRLLRATGWKSEGQRNGCGLPTMQQKVQCGSNSRNLFCADDGGVGQHVKAISALRDDLPLLSA
jgi:hypothetical protein